jgi:hypothetical protein
VASAVRVEGLRDLSKAFRVASREMSKDLRTAIEQAGEPIRQDASNRARTNISGMVRSRVPWWRMRTGVERSTIGYVAPEQRGYRGGRGKERSRRPNLADRMAPQLEAALAANRDRVVDEFEEALDEMARAWARV